MENLDKFVEIGKKITFLIGDYTYECIILEGIFEKYKNKLTLDYIAAFLNVTEKKNIVIKRWRYKIRRTRIKKFQFEIFSLRHNIFNKADLFVKFQKAISSYQGKRYLSLSFVQELLQQSIEENKLKNLTENNKEYTHTNFVKIS